LHFGAGSLDVTLPNGPDGDSTDRAARSAPALIHDDHPYGGPVQVDAFDADPWIEQVSWEKQGEEHAHRAANERSHERKN
jgi:hypothetical protein